MLVSSRIVLINYSFGPIPPDWIDSTLTEHDIEVRVALCETAEQVLDAALDFDADILWPIGGKKFITPAILE
jgi:hypothetical protein